MYKKNRKTITLLSRMMANILAFVLMLALVPVTVPTLAAYTASDWAKPEIEKAQNYGLIPNALKDADLTKPITRAEFAAIAIKTYENFTGTTVTPVATNPFTDTNDPDVLKAYNINIVNGTTNTTYTPNGILSREQAATMLTRVEKKAYITDGTYMSIAAARSHYTGTVVITEGRYSVSNGNIVLINRVAKTTSKSDVPIIWESTVNLPDEIHSYEFGVSELWGWDMLYLDGDRDPGYSRSEDV